MSRRRADRPSIKIFAFAGAVQAARDGDFAGMPVRVMTEAAGMSRGGLCIILFDRRMPIGVAIGCMDTVQDRGAGFGFLGLRPGNFGGGVDHRQGDLRHPQRLTLARAGEDHVFHAGAAQALGALLAQDPTDGVAEVGFSAAVGTHDGRDAGAVEPHLGPVVERLESLDVDAL